MAGSAAAGRFVIVGAGEAGMHAAMSLRPLGHTGPVTIIGDETHQPYERPPLSKCGANGPELKPIASPEQIGDLELLLGDGVVRLDAEAQQVETASGRIIPYDSLLLATGGAARKLPGTWASHVLRTIDDARAIYGRIGPGTSLVVIGGGLIGTELAATARSVGASVTVLEAGPRIASRVLPVALSEKLAVRHRSEGVELCCEASVLSVDGSTVFLADGQIFRADVVVSAIGCEPRVGLAEQAGLTVRNGIVVDSSMRTSNPTIWAAGDCCAMPLDLYGSRHVRLESWRAAQDQGRRAARAMLGLDCDMPMVPWFWSDQYDLGLQVVGIFDFAATVVRRDIDDERLLVFGLDDAGVLVAAGGIGPGTSIARDIKIAEMLVMRHAKPDPAALANPSISMKSMLREAA